MNFQDVDRRFAELKQQHDAGTLSAENFDAALKELMVQDDQGRWWAKSRTTGEWSYHDGTQWVKAVPPVHQAPTRSAQPQPQAQPQPYAAAIQPQPVTSGTAMIFYIVSFLVPLAGIVLYAVYKDKPFEADQKMAKTSLTLGVVSIGLSCLCGVVYFMLIALGSSTY